MACGWSLDAGRMVVDVYGDGMDIHFGRIGRGR